MTFAELDAALVKSLHELGEAMALAMRWSLVITATIIGLAFIIGTVLDIAKWVAKKIKEKRRTLNDRHSMQRRRARLLQKMRR